MKKQSISFRDELTREEKALVAEAKEDIKHKKKSSVINITEP